MAGLQSQTDVFDAIAESHELAGMSVATRCGESLQMEAHVGLRDIDRNLPVTSETTFRMASISKAVVALAVAKLVDSGTWPMMRPCPTTWTPPVHPDHPDVGLTLEHLLTHTSGIRDGDGYGDFLNASYANILRARTFRSAFGNRHLLHRQHVGNSEPGEWFQYANLNFGVLATVMEAATGMRFDLLMEELLFAPYGLDAGYRVQQLDNINDLAVLYRQSSGEWTPQADQFEGVMPMGPDWTPYLPGTSAVCFSPQGGLRISARDLTVLARLWGAGEATGADGQALTFLSAGSLSALHEEKWAYDGGNGNNYYGLFNSWGQGVHRAASGLGADEILPDVTVSPFIGHPGEAYGLISDAYATPDGSWSFCFATNGKWDGYSVGPASGYYQVEQDVFAALRNDFLACQASGVPEVQAPAVHLLGQPRVGDTLLHFGGSDIEFAVFDLLRLDGRKVAESKVMDHGQAGALTLEVGPLEFGWHVGRLTTSEGTASRLTFFVGH